MLKQLISFKIRLRISFLQCNKQVSIIIMKVDVLEKIESRYRDFILSCKIDDCSFSLTKGGDRSAYATCFAIFGLNTVGDDVLKYLDKEKLVIFLKNSLETQKERHGLYSKPFLQLLCFVFSVFELLSIDVKALLGDYIRGFVEDIDLEKFFISKGVDTGKPSSGNYAMFAAIVSHMSNKYKIVENDNIDKWFDYHDLKMNNFGFWCNSSRKTYTQFQNGYHQYEIYDFFDRRIKNLDAAANLVLDLQDPDGHFSPIPGGGGCYDYDAFSILMTAYSESNDEKILRALDKLANVIVTEQNNDGGFCESLYFRPFNMNNIFKIIRNLIKWHPSSFPEKLKMIISLSRPQFAKITTHWSQVDRGWNQSDMWDSWFRYLIIKRYFTMVGILEKDNRSLETIGIGFYHE